MTQLDIFRDYRPIAKFYTFPSLAHVSFAHQIAQRLDALDYDGGRMHWQAVSREYRAALRSQGMTSMQSKEAVDILADEVHEALRLITIQKQYRPSALIFSITGQQIEALPYRSCAGEAGALGQGTKFLAGMGRAHETTEYDAARGYDGGDAA